MFKNKDMNKEKLKNFFIDWVWQLPQNLLGLCYSKLTDAAIYLYKSKLPRTMFYNNVLPGSVSLGNYIFLSDYQSKSKTVRAHEEGHSIQSLILGPLYLIIIGLPSIIWATLYSTIPYFNKYNYYDFYTEKWANTLIEKYKNGYK